MPTVDQVGVRCLRCTRANWLGIAWCAAIEKVVRAVGRMVVWVEAAEEVSTMKISSLVRNHPRPWSPKTAPPRPESTSCELSGLPSPMPWAPTPAKDCAEVATSA